MKKTAALILASLLLFCALVSCERKGKEVSLQNDRAEEASEEKDRTEEEVSEEKDRTEEEAERKMAGTWSYEYPVGEMFCETLTEEVFEGKADAAFLNEAKELFEDLVFEESFQFSKDGTGRLKRHAHAYQKAWEKLFPEVMDRYFDLAADHGLVEKSGLKAFLEDRYYEGVTLEEIVSRAEHKRDIDDLRDFADDLEKPIDFYYRLQDGKLFIAADQEGLENAIRKDQWAGEVNGDRLQTNSDFADGAVTYRRVD